MLAVEFRTASTLPMSGSIAPEADRDSSSFTPYSFQDRVFSGRFTAWVTAKQLSDCEGTFPGVHMGSYGRFIGQKPWTDDLT